ncbi:hypothetical protein BGX29_005446, partial [Mortierella sp. GBA35]
DEAWLQDIFSKHGHHIRELRIHHRDIFRFASLSGGCTRLQSLKVFGMDRYMTIKENDELKLNRGSFDGQGRMDSWDADLPGYAGSFLTPAFEDLFDRSAHDTDPKFIKSETGMQYNISGS